MTEINRSALVPYSAKEMYLLVDDIPHYPDFLPWCRSSHEILRTDTEVEASIEIAKSGIHKSFTTRNVLHPYESIELQLVSGPFQSLHGFWRFESLDERACKVSLDIEFEFSNRLLSMTVGPVFSHICNTLVNAFVTRAQAVYGK